MANSRFDQLMQIFHSPVWDGDLISKKDRDALVDLELVEKCSGGWNIITSKGITYLSELGFIRGNVERPKSPLAWCSHGRAPNECWFTDCVNNSDS